MSSLRRLQTRLFMWMLGAILLSFAVSMAVSWLTRADPTNRPAQVLAKNVAAHLDAVWDNPEACDAFVTRMHDDTGFPLRLVRDPSALPRSVTRGFQHGSAIAYDNEGSFILVAHNGSLVGALVFEGAAGPRPPWSRIAVGLSTTLIVMGFMARRVSRQLARPLEELAQTAERFGSGDLDARTQVANAPGRWVAEEVRDVARAFDTMAIRIEAIVRDQRELLGAISHELRSPLGRARIALEIARERDSAAAAPQLDQIELELGSVDAILGDLLAVTRAGLSDLRKETTALGPWLRGRLAAEAGRPSVELGEAPSAEAAIDTALLGRAVHNVIDNARAHGHPADQALRARIVRDGDVVRIVVRDRGPGFTPDLIGRAFEPFVRGDPARSPLRGGSGLGLALVRRIAEAHGGRAFASNVVEDGRVAGAEVAIELPLAGSAAQRSTVGDQSL
jgi:two-component system OmpR family sensor kinase